jgi:CheY-like chemotaxis protein
MAKTLLLADDSVTIQKVVGISLASEDITLVTVDNGDDAVARARELRPDAILADCVMPGRSGYDVCEAIQADPALRHIPVLLLTGTFEAFDEQRAARCGAAGHIAKPFEAQTLLDEVQRLFALAASRKPAPAAAQRSAPPEARPLPAGAPQAPRPEPRLAPVAAPAPAASADSFDFFDEEIDELLPTELAEEPAYAAGDEVDLDSSESAFAFGSGEPASNPEIRRTRSPAEHTVMMLPEDPEGAWDAREAGDDLAGAAETIDESDLASLDADASMSAPGRTVLVTEGLGDLEFSSPHARDDSRLRVDDGDLAGATVLDPQGAEGFDVSASDLGDPFAVEPPKPPQRGPSLEAKREEPPASFRFDTGSLELLEPEPDPPPQPDFPEDRGYAIPEPEPEPRPLRDREVAALARNALEAVGPRLRSQLHETLEKVAWESLSDVTDQIVRHALERIEAIAWEVIPQMAETLIREEIRRMKGEEA